MKYRLILINVLFWGLASQGQTEFHRYDDLYRDSSGISLSNISESTLKNIELLGKIWGFLKYYHPEIRKGIFNWDYELFHILPQVCNKSNFDRDNVIICWIRQFEFFNSNGKKKKIVLKNVRIKPNLKWIDSSGFDIKLRDLLHSIESTVQNDRSFYIHFNEIPKPQFSNEDPYLRFRYPDAGYRILALFRYWNAIKYYYPYRYLLDEYWDKSLILQLNKFLLASNELAYKLAILELISLINDSHASISEGGEIIEHYKGNNYAPIELTFVDKNPVVFNYYDSTLGKKSKLLKGDIILSINGIPVDGLIQRKMAMIPASNYTIKLREIARELLRTNDSLLTTIILRDNKQLQFKINCYPSYYFDINYKCNRPDTCFKIIEGNIGYLNPFFLKESYIPEIMKRLLNTKGFIMDFRYPPGENILSIGNYLINDQYPFAKLARGSNEYPGSFRYFMTMKIGEKGKRKYNGKVIILNNEDTQSAAEFNTMAFRIYFNALVVGSTTAGADGDVTDIYLPGGVLTTMSGLGVYYYNAKETQQIGIIPDVIVKPTIKGIKNGKDELLDFAVYKIKFN